MINLQVFKFTTWEKNLLYLPHCLFCYLPCYLLSNCFDICNTVLSSALSPDVLHYNLSRFPVFRSKQVFKIMSGNLLYSSHPVANICHASCLVCTSVESSSISYTLPYLGVIHYFISFMSVQTVCWGEGVNLCLTHFRRCKNGDLDQILWQPFLSFCSVYSGAGEGVVGNEYLLNACANDEERKKERKQLPYSRDGLFLFTRMASSLSPSPSPV